MSGRASSRLTEYARLWKLATLALYGLCGALWLYRGSLKELWTELYAIIMRAFR